MYTAGEGLQWYDPAVLFSLSPLSDGAHGEQGGIERDLPNRAGPCNSYEAQRDVSGGGLSPTALHRHVQHRARELLLDRLSGDTLTSDRDACASVADLVKSLHTGKPVDRAAVTATHRAGPRRQQTCTTGNENPLPDSTQREAAPFPSSLSGTTSQSDSQRRQRPYCGAPSPKSMLGAGDAASGLGDLLGSHSANAVDGSDDVNDGGPDYYEYEDDDDASLGGLWGLHGSGGPGEDAAAAAKHARELRSFFGTLPTQLGVQEEPLLCPLNLQTDPLAHVVAAAEVFAVVTATVPQVLYVFDQLNNVPISSSVLGGTVYATTGSGVGAGHADGEAPMTRSFAGAHVSFSSAARTASTQRSAADSSSSGAAVRVVSCTVDVHDTVQELWMDPTGHYCVLAFVSGKCVYYYIPRRPSATTAPGFHGATTATAVGTGSKDHVEYGERGGDGDDSSAADAPGDGAEVRRRRRRQERHGEWKASVRRWLRFSRRRRSSSEGDGDGGSEVDDADGTHDSDAAYRPRGFSLTHMLSRSSSKSGGAAVGSDAASVGVSMTRASAPQPAEWTSSGFVPSCVGWSRYVTTTTTGGTAAETATTTAAPVPAATSPRGILKTRDRPPASHATSKPLAFNMDTAASTPASSLVSPGSAVEALLGARQGGRLLACQLTPAGAVDSRVVFAFPASVAQLPIDSVAAVCAPAASLYGNDAAGQDGEIHDGARSHSIGKSNSADRDADGVSPSPSSSGPARWDCETSFTPNADLGGGSGSHYSSSAAFLSSTYTRSSHFLSADGVRRSEVEAPVPPASAAARDADGTAARHRDTSDLPRRRWVVLVSVRNRLYVFSTPSTTMDFSELGQTQAASFAAVGDVPSSTLEAVAHDLTGGIEDAFVLYTGDYVRGVDTHGRSSDGHPASLVAAPSPPSPVKPALPPPSHVGSTGRAGLGDGSAALSEIYLDNYIVIEPTACSAYSCMGYRGGNSQVHTVSPDVATAMATDSEEGSMRSGWARGAAPAGESACTVLVGKRSERATSRSRRSSTAGNVCASFPVVPLLRESSTRGVVHVVLPPPRSPASSSVAGPANGLRTTSITGSPHSGGDGCGVLATPAALPPVLYWQYGDVVVQAVVLCGAGGLEVGAKVRELLRHDVRACASTAAATATTGGASSTAHGRAGDASGSTRRDGVSPTAFARSALPALGVEARLASMVDDALRDTQQIYTLEEATQTTAVENSDGGSRQGNHPYPRPTSPSSAAAATDNRSGGPPGVDAAAPQKPPLRTSTPTQPAVLPIGLLSVVNVNSCLQSLRGLLDVVSATRDGEHVSEQRSGGKAQGLSYTRCTLRTSPSLTPTPAWPTPTAAVSSSSPFPNSSGVHDASSVGWDSKAEETGAALQASVATALRHPLLEFPWTTRLQLCRERPSRSAGGTKAAEDGPVRRRRRHIGQQRLPPSLDFTSRATALKGGCSSNASFSDSTAREGSGAGSPRPPARLRFSLCVPLLSSALARGDVDADAVRRLRVVARAYVRGSPVLFDAPVASVLRASAVAAIMPRVAPVLNSHVPHPLGAAGPPSDVYPCGPSTVQSMRMTAASTAPSIDHREGGGPNALRTSAAAGADGAGGPLTTVGFSYVRDTGSAAPAPSASAGDGVHLNPDGELLVSMSASYSHIVLTTTQGVYVFAHAAVLPVVEAALLWRRELVYHAVTARAPTATGGQEPVSPPLPPARAPLFTVMADPAAPDAFYAASRVRMVRLQTTALRSSAAGRAQLVMQLLAKAAATPHAGALPHKGDAVIIDTATETVVVPSSLSYEVRLWGGRGGDKGAPMAGAVRFPARVQRPANDDPGIKVDVEDGLRDGERGQQRSTSHPSSHENHESLRSRAQSTTVAAVRLRTLPPTTPSATSLVHHDSLDLPLSSSVGGLEDAQSRQRSPQAAAAVVPDMDAGTATRASAASAPHAPQVRSHSISRQEGLARHSNDAGVPASLSVHRCPLGSTAACLPLQCHITDTFTRVASPLAASTSAGLRPRAALHQPHQMMDSSTPRRTGGGGLPSALEVAHGAEDVCAAAKCADDGDVVDFLAENPLLHFLLQRSAAANRGGGGEDEGGAQAEVSNVRALRASRRSSTCATHISDRTRAVNIPGFGVLPGSVGLTPLAHVTCRAAACLLLQKPIGAAYYCADHLYELALAACACAVHSTTPTLASSPPVPRRPVVTGEDVRLLHLVRHAYGSFLLSQQRFLEAAVQFGKAPDGPTPFTTVFMELVRAFREDDSLEPLVLFLQLRLRALAESAAGLGGHGVEVSVLATWLLSLHVSHCGIAHARRQRDEASSGLPPNGPSSASVRAGRGGKAKSGEMHPGGSDQREGEEEASVQATRLKGHETAPPSSHDFTRVAWIRRRYHLDHPAALLEDTLLRYGRFVDSTVLSTSVARLAAARETILVSELEGSPERTVVTLVLREQRYYAGLLRLQALLSDPTSQSAQTRRLLQSLVGADGGGACSLTAPGTVPLATVFHGSLMSTAALGGYGGGATSSSLLAPLPAPRDPAALPHTLALLFERFSTLFLCCYPCRFVQEGLLTLLHQRPDVPLRPRRLLPGLLNYSQSHNESVLEATGSPDVVLRALSMARRAQRQRNTYVSYVGEGERRQTTRERADTRDAAPRRPPQEEGAAAAEASTAAPTSLHDRQEAAPPSAAAAAGALRSSDSFEVFSLHASSRASDGVDALRAASAPPSCETVEADDSVELEEDDDDDGLDSIFKGLSPRAASDTGDGGGGRSGVSTGDGDQRTDARDERALRLRHALTPTLTAAVVAAAEADDGDRGEIMKRHEAGSSDNLQPAPQHAVLRYLEDLVGHHGAQANGCDDAVFAAYVNVLARDGEEDALQKFAEQTALQHVLKADAWGLTSSPSSSFATPAVDWSLVDPASSCRLLYVLRVCAAHRRWVGCAWMYYALSYHRDAVQVSLKHVVGEEGVRLAVRLLSLLRERDRRHDEVARRCRNGAGVWHIATSSMAAAQSDDASSDGTQLQEVRRSRRELWMLVARHFMHHDGHSKHGAQTALQLSMRSGGGDAFNATDVLPELPDSLCMTELKEELLSCVQELSHKMRGLRVNTTALGRDTRVLHRELQAMSNRPLSMQVDERCVLCGQRALVRPFTAFPRCRHLIHTTCYHRAQQAMLRRDEQDEGQQRVAGRTALSSPPRSRRTQRLLGAPEKGDVGDHRDDNAASEGGTVASMECLLCARRYLRVMLDAPLNVSLVGDDVEQSKPRARLR